MVTRGPQGILLVVIGLALALGTLWSSGTHWVHQLPEVLIGLSLTSFGWSIFSRARKADRDAGR